MDWLSCRIVANKMAEFGLFHVVQEKMGPGQEISSHSCTAV